MGVEIFYYACKLAEMKVKLLNTTPLYSRREQISIYWRGEYQKT